jgi:arylmalonate decarboxylase
LLVNYPLNLQSFSTGGVDKALEAFWPAFDFLVARKVERISQGGIPVSAYAGRARILAMLEEAARRTTISATADFEESIEAIRHLGIKRVAVAAKWGPELMKRIVEYLDHAGITPIGVHGHEHSAQQVVALRPQESVDVALALGREAFAKMPEADGLLLAGGSWLVMQAVSALEAEFGKPIVTNPGATYWAALRQGGLKPHSSEAGRERSKNSKDRDTDSDCFSFGQGSIPSSAPTTIVWRGTVERARLARAAVL